MHGKKKQARRKIEKLQYRQNGVNGNER